jgi:hypothetical protein
MKFRGNAPDAGAAYVSVRGTGKAIKKKAQPKRLSCRPARFSIDFLGSGYPDKWLNGR